MSREDVFFIISPFILTSLFLVFGYNLLIQQTPEARINPDANTNLIEFIDSGDIEPTAPRVDLPESIVGPIVSIPQNQASLEAIFEVAKSKNSNTLYISVPVIMESDRSFVLGGADLSNANNIMNWTEKLIATAHENGYHTIVSLNINASTTIQDPAVFATAYSKFLEEWASIVNSHSVSSFDPGITLGHPLYTNVSSNDLDKIIGTIGQSVAKKYTGRLGIGLCCSVDLDQNINQFSYITVIPTPEFPFLDMKTVVAELSASYNLDRIIYYDKDRSQVVSEMP